MLNQKMDGSLQKCIVSLFKNVAMFGFHAGSFVGGNIQPSQLQPGRPTADFPIKNSELLHVAVGHRATPCVVREALPEPVDLSDHGLFKGY